MSSRPEYVKSVENVHARLSVEQKLKITDRLYQNAFLRKSLIIFFLCAIWQGYAVWANNPLMFPTFTDTISAFYTSMTEGTLLSQSLYSLRILLTAYGMGVAIAFAFTILAINTRIGNDLLETLTSMLSPLPAIAILPIALLWFGLGETSLIFVIVNSIVWPIALNVHSGFKSVSQTLRMVGRNYGLRSLPFVLRILIPAAFPSILTGLKVGWAFGWRTLIASELVFGVSSRAGGLGWFIYENKNELEIAHVFAGLLTVILIGLFVENIVFRGLENKTINKWGMQSQ